MCAWRSWEIQCRRNLCEFERVTKVDIHCCWLYQETAIYLECLRGNIITEPLLSSEYFLTTVATIVPEMRCHYSARTNGHWSCRGLRWLPSASFNVGGSHRCDIKNIKKGSLYSLSLKWCESQKINIKCNSQSQSQSYVTTDGSVGQSVLE
jgi:hypothetical protein